MFFPIFIPSVHPKNDNHGSSKLKELYVEQGETEMMPKVNEMKEQMKTYMQEIATLKEKENSLKAEWKRGCTECNGNPMVNSFLSLFTEFSLIIYTCFYRNNSHQCNANTQQQE